MKIIKLILCTAAILAITCLPTFAEHLPEKDLIGTTVVIEKDSNIVKDNIKDDHEFDPENYIAISMTRSRFFVICTVPALIVAALGIFARFLLSLVDKKRIFRFAAKPNTEARID